MMRRDKFGILVAAACVALSTVFAGPASAVPAGSVTLTVVVIATAQAPAGDVTVVDITNTTTYGTCQAPLAMGVTRCSISVPSMQGILVVARPAPGESFQTWYGACRGAPGPVCHIFTQTAPLVTVAAFGFAGSRPRVTTVSPVTNGNPPNCMLNQTVTANGSGFPATAPATLSDDGHVVATGTTDANGFVSLGYVSAPSEPGIYRTLVLGVGAITATTDIYNSGFFCFGAEASGGNVAFTVYYSGLDANSSSATLQFRNNPPVVLHADATGAGSTTTPPYHCPSGMTFNEVISLTRGAGPFRYSYTFSIPYTCP